MDEKSKYRKEAEERVCNGKSPSQKLRHALFELHSLEKDVPEDFDVFYADWIEKRIREVLDTAETRFHLSLPK